MHFILFQHMTHLLCGTAFQQLRELCNTNNYHFACPQEPWDRFAFYSASFDFSNLRDSFFMSWSVKFWFCQGISRSKQTVVSTRDVAGELCWPSMSAVREFDWLKSRARCIISHVIPSCKIVSLLSISWRAACKNITV